jgi:hypothetical protein
VSLQDAVARSIFRDILARPQAYPTELSESAQYYTRHGHCVNSACTWEEFRKILARYAGELPEDRD